jgi:putative transcription factor
MNGQDWSTVGFGNGPKKNTGGGGGRPAPNAETAQSRFAPGTQTSQGTSAAKLDAETEELKHATVPKDLKMAIQKGRTAKGLTQKQLAQQLQMAPNIINEYESGKAIPNNAVIAKIERALGCKLPRVPKK